MKYNKQFSIVLGVLVIALSVFFITACKDIDDEPSASLASHAMTKFNIVDGINAGVDSIGIVNELAKTIDATSDNVSVDTLVIDFTTSTGSIATVNNVVQESRTTINDFTNPVVYRVTAEDGSNADYTVTIIPNY